MAKINKGKYKNLIDYDYYLQQGVETGQISSKERELAQHDFINNYKHPSDRSVMSHARAPKGTRN